MTPIKLIYFIYCLCVVVAHAASLPRDATQAMDEGQAQFARAHYSAAESAYRYVLERQSTQPQAKVGLALSLDAQGRHRQAQLIWTALDGEGSSNDVKILYYLGRSQLMNGDFVKAAASFTKVAAILANASTPPEKTLLRLSTIFLAIGQHLNKQYPDSSAQISFLEKEEKILLPIMHSIEGLNCEKTNEPACAIDRWRNALKLDSTQLEIRRRLADLQGAIGDFDNAYLETRRYLSSEDDPNYQIRLKEYASQTSKPIDALLASKESGFSTNWPKKIDTLIDKPGPNLTVGLWANAKGQAQSLAEVTIIPSGTYELILGEDNLLTRGQNDDLIKIFFISSPTPSVILYQGKQETRLAQKLTLRSVERLQGSFLMRGARPSNSPQALKTDLQTRGHLTIFPNQKGFTITNSLGLEEYLMGVLPAEIGAQSPAESYKAQAVLARSYALWRQKIDKTHNNNNNNNNNNPSYDVCDQVHCQVYKGVLSETSPASSAIIETSGENLTLENKPFQIWYHASCGGRLQYNGRLDIKKQPSQTNPSPWKAYANDDEPLQNLDPDDFLQYFEQAPLMPDQNEWCYEQSPRYAWIRLIEMSDLEEKTKTTYPKIGRLKEIRFLERGLDGRMTKIQLIGSKSSVEISDDFPIRQALAPGSLRSNLFSAIPIKFNNKQRYFLFIGRGYGHGRGACQVGALRQGKEAVSYKDILNWYYPDATITR